MTRFAFRSIGVLSLFPCLSFAQNTGYSGNAYGTDISSKVAIVGASSGATASSTLCTTQLGPSASNSIASVDTPLLLSTEAITSSIKSEAVSGGSETVAQSQVASVSLLSGLISATTITSVSTSSKIGSTYATSSAGTSFANLSVLGLPVISPAPNTTITLPGVGYVILNQQTGSAGADSADLVVIAIHVVINTANLLGIPVGTTVNVAYAKTDTRAAESLLGGSAWGTELTALGSLSSGPTADVALPCLGSNTITKSITLVNVPGVLSTGTITSEAQGDLMPTSVSAQTTNTTESIDVLSSLISAQAITADALLSGSSGVNTFADDSSFVGLVVTGHPEIPVNPPPNTVVELAGLGSLTLHEITQTATSIEIYMLDLRIDVANIYGLPVGGRIRVGQASLELH